MKLSQCTKLPQREIHFISGVMLCPCHFFAHRKEMVNDNSFSFGYIIYQAALDNILKGQDPRTTIFEFSQSAPRVWNYPKEKVKLNTTFQHQHQQSFQGNVLTRQKVPTCLKSRHISIMCHLPQIWKSFFLDSWEGKFVFLPEEMQVSQERQVLFPPKNSHNGNRKSAVQTDCKAHIDSSTCHIYKERTSWSWVCLVNVLHFLVKCKE